MFSIIDRIGSHSGMHYFDFAFVREGKRRGVFIDVISNFSSPSDRIKKAIPNFYAGSRIQKICSFAIFLWKLSISILVRRKNVFIYYSFGEWIDFYLLKILSKVR